MAKKSEYFMRIYRNYRYKYICTASKALELAKGFYRWLRYKDSDMTINELRRAWQCFRKGHNYKEKGRYLFAETDCTYIKYWCSRCFKEEWRNMNGIVVACPLEG